MKHKKQDNIQHKIWYRNYSTTELNQLSKNTLVEHLNILFEEIGDAILIASMPVDNRTKQPAGLLHGGASVALSETLGSVASLMAINDELFFPVGIEINANHIKAVKEGRVKGICRPIQVGGRIHVWEIYIYNDQDELSCISRLTTTIVAKNKL